jgi:hypothetical protein
MTLQIGTVALVGNGPVSQQQRVDIAAMDVIVRFNVPNSFSAAAGERLTVWAVRHAQQAVRRGYWGPEQLNDATSEELIARAEVHRLGQVRVSCVFVPVVPHSVFTILRDLLPLWPLYLALKLGQWRYRQPRRLTVLGG